MGLMSEKLRYVSNPPNPFDTVSRNYLEDMPRVELKVFEERAKSILSKNDSPDIPFRWSLNPYRGCQHACAYCYARPRHENLGFGAGTDFDSKIVVKTNAPQLLQEALAARKWQGESIMFSGDTDCYQPLEASYELTKRCLEVCMSRGNPVSLITKSALIVRDKTLLYGLHQRAGVQVYFSIPFSDEHMARSVEPGAPRPGLRLEAMSQLAAMGIPVGVLVAPIIPGLNDTQIPEILKAAKKAGALNASYQILRLPGSAQNVFMERLKHSFPNSAAKVENRIRESHSGELSNNNFHGRFSGKGAYWQTIQKVFDLWKTRLELDSEMDPPKSVQKSPLAEQLALFKG